MRPTREPGAIWAVPWSISNRPASRIEMSVRESIAGFHRKRRKNATGKTQILASQQMMATRRRDQ
jgi:hypothetical protein